MFERNLPKLYPGSKYGVRYPIGLMSVIDNFKPKELRDYTKSGITRQTRLSSLWAT